MLSYFKKNIKVKILLFLFLGSSVISILFALYNYNINKKYFIQKLEQSADAYADRLAQNLIVPLWEVDSEWVIKIIDTELREEELIAVSVSGEGNLYVAREKNKTNIIRDFSSFNNAKNVFLERIRPIVNADGEEIGIVTVYITRKFLDERLLNEVSGIITIVVFLLFFLSISLYIALDHFVLNPLDKLLLVVKKTSENDYSQQVEITQQDEIGRLAEGFNEMIRNILEKEEQLISQSRQAAMGDMIAMIAHQWRQPITVIGMEANNINLSILLEEEITTEELKKMADTISEQTQQLSQTIDDFRDFFKPKKEKMQTTVGSVLDSTLKIVGKSMENNNIVVIIENRSETEILTYPNELLQVFLNLLGNAKDILLDKEVSDAKITITINETKDSIVTKICDNGGGIPENAIKRLGEPYFTTKEKSTGTGLGLYMSITIVEKHLKGSLRWENRDEGACFIVTLAKE